MNPQIKKIFSALLFAALGAMLVTLGTFVPQLPAAAQATAVAVLAAAAHYLDAWGHTARVMTVADTNFAAGVAAGKQVPSIVNPPDAAA